MKKNTTNPTLNKSILERHYPFLKDGLNYRKVTKQELRSEETYRELFPEGSCLCDGSILALWKWQKYTEDEKEQE